MSFSHKHKEQLKLAGIYIAGIIICVVIGYYSWQVGREINYNWSYKDMVQETICETVKHEHLVDPKVCE